MNQKDRNHIINQLLLGIHNAEEGIDTTCLSKELDIREDHIEEMIESIVNSPEISLYDFTDEPDELYRGWYNPETAYASSYLVNFTSTQKNLFDLIIEQRKSHHDYTIGYITKTTSPLKNKLTIIDQVNRCIEKKVCLECEYRVKSGKLYKMLIEPLAVVFNEFDATLHILGQYNSILQSYRIDRIQKYKESKINYEPLDNFDINDYLSKSWGLENGAETKVKVRFDKVGNVASKLIRELAFRKYKLLTEYDDYYIYEDTIIGINNFRRWLRAYGSSARVIEPEFLINDIVDSAKECLKHYNLDQ